MRYDAHGGDVYTHPGIRLDFSVNLNPLGMPGEIIRAVADSAGEYKSYPDPRCRALCGAIARAEEVCAEDVLCGNGAADLIFRACLALRPKKTLVTAPAFSEYENAARLAQSEIAYHSLRREDGFALTGRVLEAIVPGTELIVLCTPNNPTGRLIDPALLEGILKRCDGTGAWLLLDECFLSFTDAVSSTALLGEYPRLLVLKAFTKFYAMAGLRLGYLLCKNHEALTLIGSAAQEWSVSTPAQAAGLAALKISGWAEKTRALVAAERAYCMQALSGLGYELVPSDSNFLLFRGEPDLYARLLERGILIRSCANFIGMHEGWYRIGVKTREENRELIEEIRRIKNG